MNDTQINDIIIARNEITSLPAWQHLANAVDALDRVLATVPIGQRTDVDALLGRKTAAATRWSTDEQRAEWKAEAERTGAELAAGKVVDLRDWQHGERGAGCAGNEPETCEAGGWG
jgi:hypothetical protein